VLLALPPFHVGDPLRYEGLSVFPLFAEPPDQVEYRVSDEALAGGSVTVEEVNEAGSVPELLVNNEGDWRVLFLEGEELIGAKQNRILNTSLMVAAHSKVKIPVSCVEQGRWRYSARHFQSSGSYAPAKLRRALKASVGQSIKKQRGHRADQGKVWAEVAALHCSLDVISETAAMSDAFETYKDRIAEYLEPLKYVEGATGLAVAIGDRVVCVDFFDKPSTCQYAWDRLLSGMVFDALQTAKTDQPVFTDVVQQLLISTRDLPWQPVDAVGEGNEFRAESSGGDHASVLVLEGVVVHGNIMPAITNDKQ
jgi:hypothetical protein